jgi:hypothetical protein
MTEKHREYSTTWCAPTTTWGAPDTEDVDFDMRNLEEIIMATDKNKGVGPRGCHPAYIQALFEGRHQFDDAVENPNDEKLRSNGPAKSYQHLGQLYLSGKMDPWIRSVLGGGGG